MRVKKMKYIFIFLVLFACIIIPLTYSKYIKKYTIQLSISAVQPTYSVVFDANGGTGSMDAQTFTYKTPQHLSINTFTNGTLVFDKWNTKSDGSGIDYEDEEEVDKLTTVNGGVVTLYAQWVDKAAKIYNKYYDTLEEAIDDVFASNPQTTIVLLKSVSENIIIDQGLDIILDLNHKTLSNVGNANVIQNNGTLYLKNGTIFSDASGNGAINNNRTGVIVIDGVDISITGTKQALYNDKGIATLQGGSSFYAESNVRAGVQNVSGGTMNILDATITSTAFHGLVNAGTLNLGNPDDPVSQVPVIIGALNGIETTSNFNYYDGVIKGIDNAINPISRIKNLPDGYMVVNDTEEIDDVTYKVNYLALGVKVTFDPNGGSTDETLRSLFAGEALGALPSAVKSGHTFIGWFTEKDGGEEIDETIVIEEDITFYAHYEKNKDTVSVNGTLYDTIADALNAIPNNTPTTITLLKDVFETVVIPRNKDITLDLDNFTITNAGDAAVITNNGHLTIISGTVLSSADTAAINQEGGSIDITGGNIIATGTRQALYIKAGVANISGNAYLSSHASGAQTGMTMERGAIQVLTGATLNITGGTVVAANQQGISNEGTLNIGTKDGNIDITTPVIQGNTYGVKSTGTFNIYDGILKGKTAAINGTVTEYEDNSDFVYGLENIDGADYETTYLQLN